MTRHRRLGWLSFALAVLLALLIVVLFLADSLPDRSGHHTGSPLANRPLVLVCLLLDTASVAFGVSAVRLLIIRPPET